MPPKKKPAAKKPKPGTILGPAKSKKAKASEALAESNRTADPGKPGLTAKDVEKLKELLKKYDASAVLAHMDPKAVRHALDIPVLGQKQTKGPTRGVVFDQGWKQYQMGDKAGFPPRVAKALVDAGVAHYRKGPVDRAIDAAEADEA